MAWANVVGVLLEYKDMPEWARIELAKITRSQPKWYLKICKDNIAHVGGTPNDYGRKHVVVRRGDGEVMHLRGGYYESYLNHSKLERATYNGGPINLPDNGSVLEYETHGKHLTIHVPANHPDAQLANRLDDDTDLDETEAMILKLYADHSSSGRKDAIWRYRIPRALIDMHLPSLEERGLIRISKNGAITVTVKGKRVCNSRNYTWTWYQFSDRGALRERILLENGLIRRQS